MFQYQYAHLNIRVDIEHLIAQGNRARADHKPHEALALYAQAFAQDFDSFSAWNNYGNVMREIGYPDRSIPFLEQALRIAPDNSTAQFNLAVSYLLMGDYQRGWPAYESRWNYEHLVGTLPTFTQPRWTGQDAKDKTILVVGEQGLGDCIQFLRYVVPLKDYCERIVMTAPSNVCALFAPGKIISDVTPFGQELPKFDFWVPAMSLPGLFNQTLADLMAPLHYIGCHADKSAKWKQRLGKKFKLRVGISWSGRRDTWINQHKSVPFAKIAELIKATPQYQWVNLQVDASEDESAMLGNLGVDLYPGTVSDLSDTAALIDNLDVVVSIDSAVSHLSAAMAKPTWIMLNQFAVDWRWLLNREDSPWYPTARLFRQPSMDDWDSVIKKVARHLDLFKI